MWLKKEHCIDLNNYSVFDFSNLYDFFRDVFGEDVKIKFNMKNRRYILFCGEEKLIIDYVEDDKKTIVNLKGNNELKIRFFEYLDTNDVYQRILLDKESRKEPNIYPSRVNLRITGVEDVVGIEEPKTLPFNAFNIDSHVAELEEIVKKTGKIDAKMLLKYRPEAIALVVNWHRGDEKDY